MRFLFCPFDAPSYACPAIAVAKALQARSHEVAFATGPRVADLIRTAGFERIARGIQDGKSFQLDVCALPLEVVRQVKHLEFALQAFAADVLVGHPFALGPLIVAEQRRLPVANLGLAAYVFPTHDGPPEAPLDVHAAKLHDGLLRQYNLARDVFGLPPCQAGYTNTPFAGSMWLLQTIPELEGDVDSLPEQVQLVGDCIWAPPLQQPDEQLCRFVAAAEAAAEPLFYIRIALPEAFGNFWPSLVHAVSERPVRVLAVVRNPAMRAALPDKFLAREWIAPGLALPHAVAVLAEGSSAAALDSLRHRLPSLLLSCGGEQPAVSDRLQRAGAAISLAAQSAGDLSAGAFGQAIDALLGDASLKARASHLGQLLRAVDGPARAAMCLEALGEGRAPGMQP